MSSGKCIECSRKITPDEFGLYRKLVCRNANECMCVSCMAKKFKVDEAALYNKIEQFRNDGCMLFAQK